MEEETTRGNNIKMGNMTKARHEALDLCVFEDNAILAQKVKKILYKIISKHSEG